MSMGRQLAGIVELRQQVERRRKRPSENEKKTGSSKKQANAGSFHTDDTCKGPYGVCAEPMSTDGVGLEAFLCYFETTFLVGT